MQTAFLRLLVFTGGLVTLGAELSASRLLAPFFGTSLVVWSSLIGLILVGLSVGNWLGGLWIDKRPVPSTLLAVAALASLSVASVPFVAHPLLGTALKGLEQFEVGLLASSFVGVLLLMGLPMAVLGCLTPMAIRLATHRVEESGRVTGQFFALSTLGSFLGAFLPVMVLIPSMGTRRTFVLLAALLLLVTALGALLNTRRRSAVALLALLVGGGIPAWASAGHSIKPGDDVIFEGESAYHYIRVTEDGAGWRSLRLNEGVVTHSKYHPRLLVTGGEWDYIAMAPFFNPAPYDPASEATRWAFLGAGAGSSPRLVSKTLHPERMDAVELDPLVVDLGMKYFDMQQPGLRVHLTDARTWLADASERYDVIAVDAYRQPYIPFELTTLEFFQLVERHLTDDGVLAMNVGRTHTDTRLLDSLTTTVAEVLPSIHLLELHHGRNTVLVASRQPSTRDDFFRNLEAIENPFLKIIAARARGMVRIPPHGGMVLTDDYAPVERMVNQMILGEMARMTE